MALATYIPFSPPCLGEEEIEAVAEVLRSGWITTGAKARQFEEEFAAFLGAPGALALNSCTAGLHTALVALGIGPGDEVITTPMTFAASVNVIEHVGARPVLVDVERDTLNLDPAQVEAAITGRTRAVLPVHYAGHPADMAPLQALADRHSLSIIEDAAHALPARDRGECIGASGNPTAFSFYATKNLTTGEGGMLTGDPDFVARARTISLHGMSRDAWRRYDRGGNWRYEVLLPGFKYNMTDVAAALGLVQLRKLTHHQQRRREIVQQYDAAFAGHPALETPVTRPGVEHAWHLYVLRLNPAALRINRDRFIEELAERGIGASVHFIPIHLHPYYRDKYQYQPTDFPVAYSTYFRLLSLPLHPGLREEEVGLIIDTVRAVAHEHRR
jgi:dTDP-4-amino-4,6-dideoxygalactose transaminase